MSRGDSRFSWQMPLDDPTSRAQHPQQSSDKHFSYMPTPSELRAFVYTSSPNDPPLPIAAAPHALVYRSTPAALPSSNAFAPPAYVQDEKSLVSSVPCYDGGHTLPFSPASPAQPQPQPQPSQTPRKSVHGHTRQMSSLPDISTNPNRHTWQGGAERSQLRDGPISPTNPTSPIYEPYSPHGFTSNQAHTAHAIFTPNSSYGPNGMDLSLHQPGQISHPNMESAKSTGWNHSLCACSGAFSTCLAGLVCPCVLYGQTSYRLSQKSAKKDATDMLGHSSANVHCMLMGAACALGCLFPMLQRMRIRHVYKLKGNMADDCLRGTMCCCCVAIQNEREVKSREESNRRWAGPSGQGEYSRSSAMLYAPQHPASLQAGSTSTVRF